VVALRIEPLARFLHSDPYMGLSLTTAPQARGAGGHFPSPRAGGAAAARAAARADARGAGGARRPRLGLGGLSQCTTSRRE
jgi:hypothetical protein